MGEEGAAVLGVSPLGALALRSPPAALTLTMSYPHYYHSRFLSNRQKGGARAPPLRFRASPSSYA